MSWNYLTNVQPTENWQFINPVVGSFFRMTHSFDTIPGAELFGWVCQAEDIGNGLTQLFDFQRINASAFPVIAQFEKPDCMSQRALGFRRYRALSLSPDNWNIKIEVSGATNSFVFQSGGDSNGVFYYLGTMSGNQAWSNPYPEVVGLNASSYYPVFSDLSVLTGRGNGCFATDNEQNASILIDLKAKKLACNLFSLRGRSDGDTVSSPRNFNLLGGNDPLNLQILETVTNSTLIGPNAWGAFAIAPTPPYQYFKIQQTGPTSDGNDYYLALGQIELYGTLS